MFRFDAADVRDYCTTLLIYGVGMDDIINSSQQEFATTRCSLGSHILRLIDRSRSLPAYERARNVH